MLTALTRAVSTSLADCALSFQERRPIDVGLAMRQHASYESYLRSQGIHVVSLPAEPDLPDSVFVEDTAVVVDELAVMSAPRLDSRRREVPSVAAALGRFRRVETLEAATMLEGGDVMRIGRTLYVGLSERTNGDGIAQLAGLLAPFDYRVKAVEFAHCLHLKSACTYVGQGTILVNQDWVDVSQLDGLDVVDVAPDERAAANALWVSDRVLLPGSFPATRDRLERAGFLVDSIDVSELQKAEAGVTCCSILFEADFD